MARAKGTRQKRTSEKKLPTRTEPKKSRYDRGADARRRFILDRVRRYGRVTYKEIEAAGKDKQNGFPTGYQSYQDDDDFFASYGLEPRLAEGKGVFVLRDRDVGWTFKYRLEENRPQKESIGMLGAAILLGRPGKEGSAPFDSKQPRDNLEKLQATIWTQLLAEEQQDASIRVRSYLGQYWRKRHRLVAMDAGTTTHAAAEYVANPWGIEEDGDDLPVVDGLAPNRDSFDPRSISLRVLTNCPKIEGCMVSPKCFPNVISVGGSLRKDTAARTGVLAERSMKAMKLRPDITMLGTTSLRTEDGYALMGFACDSEEEANTKSQMLEADLRCILMDSSKIQRYRSSAFTFAVCGSKSVDVVITDSGIWEVANKEKVDVDRLLWDSGVAVLVADTPS